MIRTPPQHNTTHPPGQVVVPTGTPGNSVNQGKTLDKEIEEYLRRCRCNDVHEKCDACPDKETK